MIIRNLLRTTSCVLACLSAAISVMAADGQKPWFTVLEAENMSLQGDWKVVKGAEGYFPSAPNCWSADRIRGSNDQTPATASAEVNVPADGQYAVWVRYESPYGFDVHFTLSVGQGRNKESSVLQQQFGDRSDKKYFNGTWRVQGPWRYHNTDYVYQKCVVSLKKGPAVIALSKNTTHNYMAARIVDLIYITDDLAMEPGAEMNAWRESGKDPSAFYQPAVMLNCTRPVYFRLKVAPDNPATNRVVLRYRHRGDGWRGPRRDLAFTVDGCFTERYEYENLHIQSLLARGKPGCPENEFLPPGFESPWIRYDLSTFKTAMMFLNKGVKARLWVSYNPDGKGAVAFDIGTNGLPSVLVATGDSKMEDELFRGKPAGTAEEFANYLIQQLDAYKVPGKRPFAFGNLVNPPPSFGAARWRFFEAAGGSGMYFSVPPELYLPENAKRWGANRAMAYKALQNLGLKFEYYEGDYPKLRGALEKVRDALEADGVADIPQTFKMIEESGPPALSKLAASKVISERFRDYLKTTDMKPADLLDRTTLAAAVAAGKTKDVDLWPLVNLCSGSPQDAAENPALFYHSKFFGSILFSDNCAEAAKMVEEIFPSGSRANWGASYPQDGHGVRRNWYDEFMLFRRGGMTSFGSEMTWGLNGTPYYAGTQSESYEGTIARGLAKYRDATLGPMHLLACKRYGYPAEYVELTVYSLISHGFRAVHYYVNADFTGLDHYKAMKKAGYAAGAIEEQLIGAKVVPARVALGWSETTAIWDQAEPTFSGYNMPGNLMYQLERHYLYLLLRHLQLPVDLLADADLEEGRLKDYDLYFAVGDHMTQKAAAALRSWVEAGGVLISGAGGGLWDEYNQPLDTLKDVYGIKGARQYAMEQGKAYIPGETYAVNVNDNRLEKLEQALRAKLELVHAHPVDTIAYESFSMPVLGYRQGFAVDGGSVTGTFNAGNPAVVLNSFGKGKALIMGFLPGIAYHYGAYPLLPYGRGGEDLSVYLYPDYKPLMRDAMAAMIRAVWPEMGASVATSEPFVEANLLQQKNGACFVALVNYSGKPVKNLSVRIRAAEAGNARKVTPVFGKASVKQDGSDLLVTLPIDKFEWLVLE